MNEIPDPRLPEIRDAMVSAFSSDDLRQFYSDHFPEFEKEVAEPSSLQRACRELVDFCARRDEVDKLVEDLLLERPNLVDKLSVTTLGDNSLAEWLEQHSFERNPFDLLTTNYTIDLIIQAHEILSAWRKDADRLFSAQPSIGIVQNLYDGRAVVRMFKHAMDEQKDIGIFYVEIPAAKLDDSAGAVERALLRLLIRQMSESWIRILRKQSTLLDNLPGDLLQLLFKYANDSGEELEKRFAPRQTDIEIRRKIRTLLGKHRSTLSTGIPDTASALASYIAARLSTQSNIYCTVVCNSQNESAQLIAQRLIELSPQFARHNMIVKLFVTKPLSEESTPVRWSDELLHKALSHYIVSAQLNANKYKFSDLFDEETRIKLKLKEKDFKSPDDRLIEHANGSLGRMLYLGNQIVRRHLDRMGGFIGETESSYLQYDEDLCYVLDRN